MAIKTNHILPGPMRLVLAMLSMCCMLVACGSSNSVSTAPSVLTAQNSNVAAANLAPILFAYDSGAIFYWNGAPTSAFPLLPGLPTGSRVATMKAYDDTSGNHLLAVLFSNNLLAQFNGKAWSTLNINEAGTITQIETYQNSLVIGLSSGIVIQYVDGNLHTLHSNWSSGVSKISADNSNLIVCLGDGEVFQWNGGTNWINLNSPVKNKSVSLMLVYGNDDGQPIVAIATTDAQLWQYDGNLQYDGSHWIALQSGGYEVSQLAPYSDDPNSSAPGTFAVANNAGLVQIGSVDGTLNTVLTTMATDPVTQLIAYNGTLIAGLQSGLVIQATGNPDGSFTQKTIAGNGWNSTIAQLVIDQHNDLVIRRADGALEKWNGNGGWNEVHNGQWPAELTQIVPYDGTLALGFADGSLRQWNGYDNTIVQISQSDVPVSQMVTWGKEEYVALNNGSVFRWTGQYLDLVHAPATILYDEGDPVGYDYARLNTLAHGELVECSVVAHSEAVTGADATQLSGTRIEAVPSGDTGASIWEYVASGSSNNYGPASFPASITITATDPDSGYLYAAYGDNSIVAWDGVIGHSFQTLIDSGQFSAAVFMQVYNTKLVLVLNDSNVYQIEGRNSWSKLHNTWGTAQVTQVALYNGTLLFGLSTGAIEQCDGNCTSNGNGWTELHDAGWDAPVTQLATYNGQLTVALGRYGAVEQWNGQTWTELHGNSWGSPVTQLVSNGALVVGLGNGAILQWDGAQWIELYSPSVADSVIQMAVLPQ